MVYGIMKDVLAVSLLLSITAQQVVSTTTEDCERTLHQKESNDSQLKWRIDSKDSDDTSQQSPRQNFSDEIETLINKQINMELYASYMYLSMAYHFDRHDRYLPGFSKFFKEAHEEESKHAQMFMKYQNMRGGRIKLEHIEKPCKDDWKSGLSAMKAALVLERDVNQQLLDLHSQAETVKDKQLQDFIEGNFLNEQVESIKEISNYVNTLKRLKGSPLGEYQFDKLTLGGK